jgi:hypothetical protein
MIEKLCAISVEQWAGIIGALAAIGALWVGAIANLQSAKAQSLENVYAFLTTLDAHTTSLGSAKDPETHSRERLRTLNFFEATCHGLNESLFSKEARDLIRINMINLIAAIEVTGSINVMNLPTSNTYSEIATFVKANRTAINQSISEQQAAGVTV